MYDIYDKNLYKDISTRSRNVKKFSSAEYFPLSLFLALRRKKKKILILGKLQSFSMFSSWLLRCNQLRVQQRENVF